MAGVGCRARIYAKFHRKKHDWVLLKVELNHSHPCSTKKALHYHENRKLTMHAKCIIEVNDEAGIRPNKTFLALANEVGGPSNLGFSEKDVRNYISSTLLSTNVSADVKEMLNYYMRMKELNPNYFYAVNLNEDNKFMSAVWVDVRCRASYEYYGDVVSFDTTESTNRHGLPFAAFIGVNYHGKSTLLGCALVAVRRSRVLSRCSHNGWSAWERHRRASSQTNASLCLVQLRRSFLDLFEDRHMWVPIFFKGQLWASMRSTQRSECMHSFFGGYLNCKTSLAQFVHEFNNVLGTKEQKELEDDAADSRVLSSYKVNEVPSCYVLPRWSKNIKRKHTYIKSSHDVRRSNESHNIFRGLCAHFYNVAQEFVDCDDEADMLHNVLEDARAKLADYHGRMRNNTVATEHNSIVTDPSIVFGTEDIQTPSKKIHAEKAEEFTQDNHVESAANQDSEASAQEIAKQELGGFMSLLNSFDNT
ncbi:Protein FAR1-RELATED SEQUENCE [Arachis hypogaea]|nr:Protein FAR1-RELATED SEQUENCE [Arachis hypogaea]